MKVATRNVQKSRQRKIPVTTPFPSDEGRNSVEYYEEARLEKSHNSFSFWWRSQLSQVFDSGEVASAFKPQSIIVTNLEAPTTQPSPLPPAYPGADVEVMLTVYES